MHFKVDRKILKKALVWLKTKLEDQVSSKNILFPGYIEQIEFALYKTKLTEFYIDYEFAKANADVYLSGDFKHHNYIDAKEDNFAIVSFSHYASEIIAEDILKDFLAKKVGVQVITAKQERPFKTIK